MELIKPVKDKILVEERELKENKSVLVLPDELKSKIAYGETLDIGGAVRLVEKGNVLMFSRAHATGVKFGDKQYLLIREEDVMAVIQ